MYTLGIYYSFEQKIKGENGTWGNWILNYRKLTEAGKARWSLGDQPGVGCKNWGVNWEVSDRSGKIKGTEYTSVNIWCIQWIHICIHLQWTLEQHRFQQLTPSYHSLNTHHGTIRSEWVESSDVKSREKCNFICRLLDCGEGWSPSPHTVQESAIDIK